MAPGEGRHVRVWVLCRAAPHRRRRPGRGRARHRLCGLRSDRSAPHVENQVEDRAVVIRQPSGHGVTRIEPDWARAGWLGDVIVALKFAPDEHRTFTWRRD